MKRRRFAASLATTGAAVALAVSGLLGSSAASAQTNPYERGPAPTVSSLREARGPYATTSVSVGMASGFGGGRIYYPTSTSDGTFGGVVLAPGFTAGATSYAGVAQRVASHGFVVFAIDTNTRMDLPGQRGDQIIAALDHLTESSPSEVRSRLDASRLAVSGHSMGGGGALEATLERPDLEASVPLQPWHSTKSFSRVSVPTMIVAAESDVVAPTGSHAEPFYRSIPSSTEKAYVELRGESHLAANTNPADQGIAMVTWLKRYVDDDARYEQFMCPGQSGTDFSDWQNTCPGGGDGGGTPAPTTPSTTTPPAGDCAWWEWWC